MSRAVLISQESTECDEEGHKLRETDDVWTGKSRNNMSPLHSECFLIVRMYIDHWYGLLKWWSPCFSNWNRGNITTRKGDATLTPKTGLESNTCSTWIELWILKSSSFPYQTVTTSLPIDEQAKLNQKITSPQPNQAIGRHNQTRQSINITKIKAVSNNHHMRTRVTNQKNPHTYTDRAS